MGHCEWMKIIDNVGVNATAIIYSDPIEIGNGKAFGLKVLPDSGTVDVKVEYQIIESNQHDVNFVGKVAGKENLLTWTTPTTGATIFSNVTTASGTKADGFSPMATHWFRIKVTGNAANGADAKVSVKFSQYSA